MRLADLIAGKAPEPGTVANVATVTVANPSGDILKGEMSKMSQALGKGAASPLGEFATATLATDATLAAPTALAEARLREALARAAEGLPITLDELMREFGAEGREGWEAGDYAHPAFLRAFAMAVSERLKRERATETTPAPTPAPTPPPGPLDGLPLLREDLEHIERRTRGRRDHDSLLVEYARRWKQAADAEPVEIRKANKGRFAANSWLREVKR